MQKEPEEAIANDLETICSRYCANKDPLISLIEQSGAQFGAPNHQFGMQFLSEVLT
jgi:hypothetical protein